MLVDDYGTYIEKKVFPRSNGNGPNDIRIHILFVECIISNASHNIHSELFIFYELVSNRRAAHSHPLNVYFVEMYYNLIDLLFFSSLIIN